MDNLTPGQIVLLFIGGLLAMAGFINTVGSAVEKAVKAWRAVKAPNAAQDSRLDDLEGWRKEIDDADILGRMRALEAARNDHDKKLANDKLELETIRDGLRVSHLAQLALLDHGIDGNNIEQMQRAKEELQSHLINR